MTYESLMSDIRKIYDSFDSDIHHDIVVFKYADGKFNSVRVEDIRSIRIVGEKVYIDNEGKLGGRTLGPFTQEIYSMNSRDLLGTPPLQFKMN